MKQTAVDFLVGEFKQKLMGDNLPNWVVKIIEQAKEMEKQQIMDAYLIDGYTELTNDYWRIEFEEYYNETFKSE
jgi:hypothetical protein